MKKFVLLILLFITYSAMSQSLSVFDIDASNFPTIKAKFYAFDKDGKQITNLNPNDFEVNEKGNLREVVNISCPTPKSPKAISSVLVFDMSGSMVDGPPRIQSAKNAANAWIDGLPFGKSECALISFNETSFIVQDFTTFRDKLKLAVNKLTPKGGTNYNQALIDLPAGGLQIAKNGNYKKVIIFLTDGLPNSEPNTSEIIKFAKENQITIYGVTLDMPAPQSIKDMTLNTGGQYFENITTQKEAEETYLKLLNYSQEIEPCEIVWESEIPCYAGIVFCDVRLKPYNLLSQTRYNIGVSSYANLDIKPISCNFVNVLNGSSKETEITVKAKELDFNITNIISSNPKFDINPKSFYLKKGEQIKLKIKYTPTDNKYDFCKFEFVNDVCPIEYSANNMMIGSNDNEKSLKLLHPNGGERIVAGEDTTITWDGISITDKVNIDISYDNGVNWQELAKKVSGLNYKWKNVPKIISDECLIKVQNVLTSEYDTLPVIFRSFFIGHTGDVTGLLWNPNGLTLSTICNYSPDRTIKIWEPYNADCILTFDKFEGKTYEMAWSPDGQKIAISTGDEIIVFNAITGEKQFALNSNIYRFQWSPDGNQIVTAGGTLKIWDIYDISKPIAESEVIGFVDYDTYLHWTSDGSKIIISSDETFIRIIDAKTAKTIRSISSLYNKITAISVSPDGKYLAYANRESDCFIFDLTNYSLIRTFSRYLLSEALRVDWKPDATQIGVSYFDYDNVGNYVRIFDIATGKLVFDFAQHGSKQLKGVFWNPDQSIMALGGSPTLKLFNSLNEEKIFEGRVSRSIEDIKWSPDGNLIAVLDGTEQPKIFQLNNIILQTDTSDAVFSIVAPQPIVNDIDMKQELVGGVKDSLILDFVFNNGNHPFKVDSISITGADADVFSIVSGFPPFSLNGKEGKTVEMRFIPNRVGMHQAQINVYMRDEIITRNIIGEGVQPFLVIENELIDFGAVELQNFKDTIQVATIKNIGNAPIIITNTKHNYPNDVDFTTLSGGGNFTLQPNEIHKMDLRFSANSVGRTSGTLEFHYDGVGSPAVVQLYGQGLGGNVIIPDDSAYAGDRIKVKLVLGNEIKPKSNDLITNFKVILSYNPTLLYCDEPSAKREYNKSFETIELYGKWDGTSSTLGAFDFIVGLGNADSTEVTLEEFYWLDKDNNIIDFEVEKQSGQFTLLGICEEGGTRLLNPYSKAGITSISPNPAENLINIELSLTEFGETELSLYNLLGEKVSTIFSESVSQKSIIEVNSDISKIGSGQYLLIFRTPTYTETRQLLILR